MKKMISLFVALLLATGLFAETYFTVYSSVDVPNDTLLEIIHNESTERLVEANAVEVIILIDIDHAFYKTEDGQYFSDDTEISEEDYTDAIEFYRKKYKKMTLFTLR